MLILIGTLSNLKRVPLRDEARAAPAHGAGGPAQRDADDPGGRHDTGRRPVPDPRALGAVRA